MAEPPQVDPEDVVGFSTPSLASELRDMPDDEMFVLVRRVGFQNQWPFSEKVRFEADARLIAALKDFKRASDRASAVIIALTVALVVLTAALLWLTTRL